MAALEKDYQELRGTGHRHTACSATYCLKGRKTCRFAESLAVVDAKVPHFFAKRVGKTKITWLFRASKADPLVNTTSPVLASVARSNTDTKIVATCYGSMSYALKASGYTMKAPTKSDKFSDMLVSALKDADPAKPASVVLQTVGNATIKRDYGALTKFRAAVSPPDCAGRPELAKLALCHDTIETSLKFMHVVISGPRAVVAADGAGDEESEDDDDASNRGVEGPATCPEGVLVDENDEDGEQPSSRGTKKGALALKPQGQELYWLRMRIFDAQPRPSVFAYEGQGTTRAEYDAARAADRAHLAKCSLEGFYGNWECTVRRGRPPNSVGTYNKYNKYKIARRVEDAEHPPRIVVVWPRYPSSLKRTNHPHHDVYCRLQLLRLYPHEDEAALDAYIERHGGVAAAYLAFTTDVTPRHEAFCDVHIAGDSDDEADDESTSSESNASGNNDDVAVETWMRALMQRGSTSSELGLPIVGRNYDWQAHRAKYDADTLHRVSRRWLESAFKMCESGDFVLTPPKPPRVDRDRLGPEQMLAFRRLVAQHLATRAYDEGRSAEEPRPVRIIIYGVAGTGKSFVLGAFTQWLDDEYGPGTSTRLTAIVAPTAIAAKNADAARGTTLHRGLGVPFKVMERVGDLAGSEKLAKLQDKHEETQYILADEIGMIGARTWGAAHTALGLIKVVDADSPTVLGGVNCVAFGHHAQLPPVKDKRPYAPKMADALQVLGRKVYFQFDECIILRKQHRRDAAERRLGTFQEHLMDGKVTSEDWEFASSLALDKRPTDFLDRPGVVYVVARHAEKKQIDHEMLVRASRLSGTPVVDVDARYSTSKAKKAKPDDKPFQHKLRVVVGAKVMCIHNSFLEAGVCNGLIGTVYDIIFDHGAEYGAVPTAILVRFAAEDYWGPSALPDVPGVVAFNLQTADVMSDSGHVYGQMTQFPLMLCGAITVHKCQGLTMACVVGHAGPKEFAVGIIYVLLTRIKKQADFAWLEVPSFARLTSFSKSPSITERHCEENRLEEVFYQTILKQLRVDVATLRVDLLDANTIAHEGTREKHREARLALFFTTTFVPCHFEVARADVTVASCAKGRKFATRRVHRGGCAVALVDAVQARIRRVVARRRVAERREDQRRAARENGLPVCDVAAWRQFARELHASRARDAAEAKSQAALKWRSLHARARAADAAKKTKEEDEAKRARKSRFSKKRAGLTDIDNALQGAATTAPDTGTPDAKKPGARGGREPKKPAGQPPDRKKPSRKPKADSALQEAVWFQSKNPKKRGSQSWARYEKYKRATTMAQFRELGGTTADLRHDKQKEFCLVGAAAAEKHRSAAASSAPAPPPTVNVVERARAAAAPSWDLVNVPGDNDCLAYSVMPTAVYQDPQQRECEVRRFRGRLVRRIRLIFNREEDVDLVTCVRTLVANDLLDGRWFGDELIDSWELTEEHLDKWCAEFGKRYGAWLGPNHMSLARDAPTDYMMWNSQQRTLDCHYVPSLAPLNSDEGRLDSVDEIPVAASTTFVFYNGTNHWMRFEARRDHVAELPSTRAFFADAEFDSRVQSQLEKWDECRADDGLTFVCTCPDWNIASATSTEDGHHAGILAARPLRRSLDVGHCLQLHRRACHERPRVRSRPRAAI